MSESAGTCVRLSGTSGELKGALGACRSAFIGVGLTSGLVSILYLTGSFYMLEIYDRVVPGRSIATLMGLSVLALTLYAFQSILDIIRGRILVRMGSSIDHALGQRAYEAVARARLQMRTKVDGVQPLRDVDSVRSFLSGPGLSALFDLPWIPLYLGLCFLFHFWIGMTALVGALVLVGATLYTEWRTREPNIEATRRSAARHALAEASRRNAEVLQALGMRKRLGARWAQINGEYNDIQRDIADASGAVGALTKAFRMVLQSAVLGVGAYLVIHQQATAGVMVAASILSARALAPVELAIAHWRAFIAARQGWQRLNDLLLEYPLEAARLALPRPKSSLAVEAVSVVPSGSERFAVQDVSFQLKSGDGLGIIGPSASGKSSLARALVGVWTPVRGKVRLDAASVDHWTSEALGLHIGYLPQDVELFAGSVTDNIARFEPDPDPQTVIAAARAAGVHEMILELPNGYETEIGEGGSALSAGQRQRIALARALYRDPFLLVLDEPNSNLDAVGDAALTEAVQGVRARGGIVVIIAHRPVALAGVDQLLVLSEGRMQFFGPKEQILKQLVQQMKGPPQPAIAAGAAKSGPTAAANAAQAPLRSIG